MVLSVYGLLRIRSLIGDNSVYTCLQQSYADQIEVDSYSQLIYTDEI